jgi:hypothetical protein
MITRRLTRYIAGVRMMSKIPEIIDDSHLKEEQPDDNVHRMKLRFHNNSFSNDLSVIYSVGYNAYAPHRH